MVRVFEVLDSLVTCLIFMVVEVLVLFTLSFFYPVRYGGRDAPLAFRCRLGKAMISHAMIPHKLDTNGDSLYDGSSSQGDVGGVTSS